MFAGGRPRLQRTTLSQQIDAKTNRFGVGRGRVRSRFKFLTLKKLGCNRLTNVFNTLKQSFCIFLGYQLKFRYG